MFLFDGFFLPAISQGIDWHREQLMTAFIACQDVDNTWLSTFSVYTYFIVSISLHWCCGCIVLHTVLCCLLYCVVMLTVLCCLPYCAAYCVVLLTVLCCLLFCAAYSVVLLTVLCCLLCCCCSVLLTVLCCYCTVLLTVLCCLLYCAIYCVVLLIVLCCLLYCAAYCVVLLIVLCCLLCSAAYCIVLLTVLCCLLYCAAYCAVTVMCCLLCCAVLCCLLYSAAYCLCQNSVCIFYFLNSFISSLTVYVGMLSMLPTTVTCPSLACLSLRQLDVSIATLSCKYHCISRKLPLIKGKQDIIDRRKCVSR